MVKWDDLFAVTEKERAEIGKTRATAFKEYSSNPVAESQIPLNIFLEYFIGFTKEQIELINEIREADLAKAIAEELPVSKEENELIEKEGGNGSSSSTE
jgi:hypothetical protein